MAVEDGLKKRKRPRISRKWRILRRAVQILILLLFLYLLVGTQQGGTTLLPHDLFFRLDPLAGASAMAASRSWIAPMALSAIILLLTLAAGRAWCGWLCPLGLLLDWTPARHPGRERLDIHPYWRQVKYFLLFTMLFAAAAGSLTLLILDPITLLFRTISCAVLPLFNVVVTFVETWLYGISPLQPAVVWFDNLLRSASLLVEQPFFMPNLILALVFASVLALNTVRPRFWCRYLCPLGGLLGLVSRIALVRQKVDNSKCISCQRCATICHTGAINPEQNFAASPAECTTCLDCVETCPTRAISFGRQRSEAVVGGYDPWRRQLLASVGAAVVGAALVRVVPLFYRSEPQLIRPPGTAEEQLLSQCIRCGECLRVCPTGVLQPDSSMDWEGLWTPKLMTRLGYCDYSCNSCGEVCPTGAITRLSLAEKQRAIIGIARIDQKRCIPWAEGRECIVCEEMCPVAEKAIRLSGGGRGNYGGRVDGVSRPRVVGHLCIGCGICEYQCPVNGESAIRIFPV